LWHDGSGPASVAGSGMDQSSGCTGSEAPCTDSDANYGGVADIVENLPEGYESVATAAHGGGSDPNYSSVADFVETPEYAAEKSKSNSCNSYMLRYMLLLLVVSTWKS
jgi:hypothetical protein